jgi:hypothetical protein
MQPPTDSKGNTSGTATATNSNSNLPIDDTNINQVSQLLLRVDCYPKDVPYLEGICQQLQQHCTHSCTSSTTTPDCATTETATPIDPFDGPIPMTMSKSKCTHKLSIVIIPVLDNTQTTTDTDTSSKTMDVYWGIECRQKHQIGHGTTDIPRTNHPPNWMLMDVPLNHEAAEEIIIVPGIVQQHPHPHRAHHHHPHRADIRQGHVPSKTRYQHHHHHQPQPQQQHHLMPSSTMETSDATLHTNTNNNTGTTIIPLSRAYYKLHEIWYTYLYPHERKTLSHIYTPSTMTSAIDLGAAPGGWTQVLLHHMNVTHVLAIDRAQLAPYKRFIIPSSTATPPPPPPPHIDGPMTKHIFHVPSTLEHLNLQLYYTNFARRDDHIEKDTGLVPPKVFSYLVCDASVQWNVLLPMIIHKLQQEGNMNVIQWTIPSVVVLTLKLPFKTIHSIQRHIVDIQKVVPNFIQQLSTIMYGQHMSAMISSKYCITHCMANSDSERTLIVIFQSSCDKTKPQKNM